MFKIPKLIITRYLGESLGVILELGTTIREKNGFFIRGPFLYTFLQVCLLPSSIPFHFCPFQKANIITTLKSSERFKSNLNWKLNLSLFFSFFVIGHFNSRGNGKKKNSQDFVNLLLRWTNNYGHQKVGKQNRMDGII